MEHDNDEHDNVLDLGEKMQHVQPLEIMDQIHQHKHLVKYFQILYSMSINIRKIFVKHEQYPHLNKHKPDELEIV